MEMESDSDKEVIKKAFRMAGNKYSGYSLLISKKMRADRWNRTINNLENYAYWGHMLQIIL